MSDKRPSHREHHKLHPAKLNYATVNRYLTFQSRGWRKDEESYSRHNGHYDLASHGYAHYRRPRRNHPHASHPLLLLTDPRARMVLETHGRSLPSLWQIGIR